MVGGQWPGSDCHTSTFWDPQVHDFINSSLFEECTDWYHFFLTRKLRLREVNHFPGVNLRAWIGAQVSPIV